MNRQKRRRLDRSDRKTAELTALLALVVLNERFGFGETRLERFMDGMNEKIRDLESIRISDLAEEIERKTGWKIQL